MGPLRRASREDVYKRQAFYYIAVALLTGAFGSILNSTQSFLGAIFAHFIYGNADRMSPAKTLGCAVGFAGVLIGTLGNHGGGDVYKRQLWHCGQ